MISGTLFLILLWMQAASWAQTPLGEPVEQLQKKSTDAVVAAPTPPPITPARIAYLVDLARRIGVDQEIGPRTGVPLGFVTPGVRQMTKQLTFRTKEPNLGHILAVPVGDSRKLLVFNLEGRDANVFVIDMEGNLLAAGIIRAGKFSLVTLDQARESFHAEMRVWAERDFTRPGNAPVRK